MKFYVPCDKAHHVEDQDVIWLEEATLEFNKKRLVLYQWSDGYIFEADESFQTFFAIQTGFQMPYITDQEYAQLIVDKIAYLDKARVNQLRVAWAHLHPKINNR